MSYHNAQLPTDIEQGSKGGPIFRTLITSLSTGNEQRNIEMSQPSGAWDVGYGIDTKEQLDDVITFFYQRQGMVHSFRFKDWADYQLDNQVALGDGATIEFPIYKLYTSGGSSFQKRIFLPCANTVSIYLGTTKQTALQVSVTHNGTLVFAVAPTNGQSIRVVCEYDNVVRFNMDHLSIQSLQSDVVSMPQIDIQLSRDTIPSTPTVPLET